MPKARIRAAALNWRMLAILVVKGVKLLATAPDGD
jgi:hypothetical protein